MPPLSRTFSGKDPVNLESITARRLRVRRLATGNHETKDHAEIGRVSIPPLEFAKPCFGCRLVYCGIVRQTLHGIFNA
jgi:hypothetical protein